MQHCSGQLSLNQLESLGACSAVWKSCKENECNLLCIISDWHYQTSWLAFRASLDINHYPHLHFLWPIHSQENYTSFLLSCSSDRTLDLSQQASRDMACWLCSRCTRRSAASYFRFFPLHNIPPDNIIQVKDTRRRQSVPCDIIADQTQHNITPRRDAASHLRDQWPTPQPLAV